MHTEQYKLVRIKARLKNIIKIIIEKKKKKKKKFSLGARGNSPGGLRGPKTIFFQSMACGTISERSWKADFRKENKFKISMCKSKILSFVVLKCK